MTMTVLGLDVGFDQVPRTRSETKMVRIVCGASCSKSTLVHITVSPSTSLSVCMRFLILMLVANLLSNVKLDVVLVYPNVSYSGGVRNHG